MPDLETSVRRLLADRAASLAVTDPLPPEVLRRARRRRVRSGAAAGMLVVAMLFGGSVALGRLAAHDTTTDVVTQPPPSLEVTEPPPTVPATTVVPAAPPTTTVAPSTTVATRLAPAPAGPVRAPTVNGVPQVKTTPGKGPAGTRVRVEGSGFTDEQWRGPGKMLWLAGSGGCGVTAQAEHDIQVTADGRLTGGFTVPARGACPQSDVGDEPVVAGRYRIAFACTACTVGEFEVTVDPSAGTPCGNVGFTPDSDDVASSVVAWNMACPEAEALVAKVGQPLGFDGPATAEADGFRCVRTGQEERALPMAFYECTNGARRVTFTRT